MSKIYDYEKRELLNKLTSAQHINIVLITIFAIFIPATTYAARPLSTDDTGVVDIGHIEIEIGYEYVKQADKEHGLSFVLKYGLIKDLDLGIELPYKFIDFGGGDDVEGIGDIIFTIKYLFWDESSNLPALALTFTIKTETGNKDKGLGSGEVDYGLNGIITKEINKFVTHLNFGYIFVGDPEDEDLDDIFSYSVALEYPINERLNIVGEITGETAFEGSFNDNPLNGMIGLNYVLNRIVSYDFGVGFGICDASPDYRIITGLTFGF